MSVIETKDFERIGAIQLGIRIEKNFLKIIATNGTRL